MAEIAIVILVLLHLLHTTAAQERQYNITPGSTLTPSGNASWPSPSGLYAFGFYPQGSGYAVGIFITGIPEKTVVWTSNRDSPPLPSNATLQLTTDGRLITEQLGGPNADVVTTSGQVSSASMLDSGNFVVYDSNSEVVWQSYDNPTDTLVSGQRLANGQTLFSSTSEANQSRGIFRLKMQNDGNLVQYPIETPDTYPYAYWASGTSGRGINVTLNLEDDGHLYLFNSTTNILNLTRGGYPRERKLYLMKVNADGIFRLYQYNLDQGGNYSVLWSSSDDRCNPKGLCGLNGFCVALNEEPQCDCLPGFDFVNPVEWSSGCRRNFSMEGCDDGRGMIRYSMTMVRNTVWEDIPYATLQTITQQECEAACLEDCSCEAALFKDQKCSKQRLPMRYGQRVLSDSTAALVKVGAPVNLTNGGPYQPKGGKTKELRRGILIGGAIFGGFFLITTVVLGLLAYKKEAWAYKKVSERGSIEFMEDVALRSFSYAELELATNGFREEVGRGSSGTVYKGMLQDNSRAVAVKRLEKEIAEGETEFYTEMKVIGRTHHRNLVKLLGYSLNGPKKLLVYEYMSNGSLADTLFKPENKPNWNERIDITLGIARGILYLHEECETQIIHCDIKPQNILMDENKCAKISDFGLAKLLKHDQTKTFTAVRGTRGYVAPEWHRKMPVTVKADVYSFGIVLLEIVCCRRSIDWSLPEDEAILQEWICTCFEAGDLQKLVSDEVVDKRKFERMIKVGLWCIQDEPSLRPSMKKVLLMLEGTVDIPIPPSPTSFLSAM